MHPSRCSKRRWAAVLVASLFVSTLQKASRKSLKFATTAEQPQQAVKDCIDSNLNIEDLPTDGTQVEVVIVDSTGKPTTRIPSEDSAATV